MSNVAIETASFTPSAPPSIKETIIFVGFLLFISMESFKNSLSAILLGIDPKF